MDRRLTILAQVMPSDMRPSVALKWGSMEGQLTPEESFRIGLRFLQCAIEAERDTGFLVYMLTKTDISPDLAAFLLKSMRDTRSSWDPAEPVNVEGFEAARREAVAKWHAWLKAQMTEQENDPSAD